MNPEKNYRLPDLKPGDWVKARTRKDFAENYGDRRRGLGYPMSCGMVFRDDMQHLCDEEYEVLKIYPDNYGNRRSITLRGYSRWHIVEEMLDYADGRNLTGDTKSERVQMLDKTYFTSTNLQYTLKDSEI